MLMRATKSIFHSLCLATDLLQEQAIVLRQRRGFFFFFFLGILILMGGYTDS